MQNQQETGKKRLSLDVFQEKAIGTTADVDQNGGALSTLLCSIIVVSIIFTISSDSSRCCSSSDCHATN